jgi:urea transport system permease protein
LPVLAGLMPRASLIRLAFRLPFKLLATRSAPFAKPGHSLLPDLWSARLWRIAVLALALILGALPGRPALAQGHPADAAFARFATDRFPDTQRGIEEIVAAAHPNAVAVLEALGEGRLFAGPAGTFVKSPAGTWSDARNGEAVAVEPQGVKAVRINNALRRTLQASLGGLGLLHPEPARRYDAAQAVFKSRDATVLATLEAAIARESVPRVKKALSEARAAVQLTRADASPAARIEAIEILRERGDREAAATLRAVPAESPAIVKDTAARAIEAIENRLALWASAENIWYGISLGSVLLLAAIGLAITFGVMGVINMAHGEMVMIGAYVTFVVQEMIRTHAPGLFDHSLTIALPLAFLTAGAIGVAIERGVIRFLYGRPLETLLATWGISLILQQAVRTIFGPTNREVGAPSFMSGSFELGGLAITYNRLAIVIFAMVVFVTLLLVLRYTALGLQMRAVTQNRRMARAMGIRTGRIDALTFGLGSGIAGLAGVALAQIDNVSPNLGQSYIIDSFLVVVFGGVGNLWGTLVAALALGIANKGLEPYAGAVLGKILLLVFIILFIQKRPRGLFALKGRAVEA